MLRILLIYLFSFNLYAEEVVTILASDSIPPYVMTKENGQGDLPGLQVELVDAALNEFSIKTNWKFMTNNRIVVEYNKKIEYAALNISFMSQSDNVFESDPVIYYKNCVIGRSSLKATWFKELKSLKILGHQRAKNIYASVFGDYDFDNKNYNEVTNQKTLAYHAVSYRTDLVLSDALVLSYYANKHFGPQFKNADLICLKEIKSPRSLGFKSAKLRDQFNQGLKLIKSKGLYKKILDKYSNQFSSL